MARAKIRTKFSKIFGKKWQNFENLKNSIFSKFFAFFIAHRRKNRLNLNKKLMDVTRRAGCLILGSKSNTVSGKIESGRLTTNRDLFSRNSNFWLSFIRSNFDLRSFPETADCDGFFGYSAELLYRLWLGQKFEQSFRKISEKNDKISKIWKIRFFQFFSQF